MPTRSPHEEPPGPTAPAIPSFASLRSPRRRSAIDLLVPDPAPTAAVPVAAVPVAAVPVAAARAPRPAEYGDLLRLGLRAARAVAGLPGCLLQRLRSGLGG